MEKVCYTQQPQFYITYCIIRTILNLQNICYKFCHSTFTFAYTSGAYIYTSVHMHTWNSELAYWYSSSAPVSTDIESMGPIVKGMIHQQMTFWHSHIFQCSDCTRSLKYTALIKTHTHARTHARTFNGPFSGTSRVSRYQKGKPIWILLKQGTVSGYGISWAICKSAPHSTQITIPAPHHSVFYRPDALPASQPTVSKHWRPSSCNQYWLANYLSSTQ